MKLYLFYLILSFKKNKYQIMITNKNFTKVTINCITYIYKFPLFFTNILHINTMEYTS